MSQVKDSQPATAAKPPSTSSGADVAEGHPSGGDCTPEHPPCLARDVRFDVLLDRTAFSKKPHRERDVRAICTRLKQTENPKALQAVTADELVYFIENGQSYSLNITREQTIKTWERSQGFAVDIDNDDESFPVLGYEKGIELAEAAGVPCCIAYRTFNDGIKGEADRYRLLFLFAEPVTDRDTMQRVMDGFHKLYPESDSSCYELSRFLYGTDKQADVFEDVALLAADEIIERLESYERIVQRIDGEQDTAAEHEAPEGFQLPSVIKVSQRHKLFHKLVSSYVGRGDPQEIALAAVRGINADRTIVPEPWDDSEIVELVNDCYKRYELGAPAQGFPWGNPHLQRNKNTGEWRAPSVPAVVWWLDQPEMNLSQVRYNELDGQIHASLLTWDGKPHLWCDADSSYLLSELQQHTHGLVKRRDDVRDALIIHAHNRSYDPLIEMLDGLPAWDGTPRAETIIIDLLGADDTTYNRAVSRLMLNGAVMRAYHGGCKFDYVVVLEGTQGCGKTTFVRKLNMKDEFYMAGVGDISKKDALENLQGCWIIEFGEFEGLKKSDAETIKLFVSQQQDRYRPSYGRFAETKPRRCIFIATTNEQSVLIDKTGNRRFLPVHCDRSRAKVSVVSPEADEYIKQAYAEVLHDYRQAGALGLELPDEVAAEALEQQGVYTVDDPNESIVVQWLADHCRDGERICVVQVLQKAFNLDRAEISRSSRKALQNDIAALLDRLPETERVIKPKKPLHSPEYGQQRCWTYHPDKREE